MATKNVRYISCNRICPCETTSIYLCLDPSLVLSGLHTIPATIVAVEPTSQCCAPGTIAGYTYTISYDDALLVGSHTLLTEEIEGVVCDDCYAAFVKDKVAEKTICCLQSEAVFGDGSEGDRTITSADHIDGNDYAHFTEGRNYHYQNLTIEDGAVLRLLGPIIPSSMTDGRGFASHYQLFVNGTLTIKAGGAITASGIDGGDGGDGSAGSGYGTPGAEGRVLYLDAASNSYYVVDGCGGGCAPGGLGGYGATPGYAAYDDRWPGNSGQLVVYSGTVRAGGLMGGGPGGVGGTGGDLGGINAYLPNPQQTANALPGRAGYYQEANANHYKEQLTQGGIVSTPNWELLIPTQLSIGGGVGGSGGGSGSYLVSPSIYSDPGGGGGGGAAGGSLYIAARNIVIETTGAITANGGDGGDGGDGASTPLGRGIYPSAGGGGGGGGGGGLIYLVYETLTNAGTIEVAAGQGGVGGEGKGSNDPDNGTEVVPGGDGTAGTDGTIGNIYKLNVCTGQFEA